MCIGRKISARLKGREDGKGKREARRLTRCHFPSRPRTSDNWPTASTDIRIITCFATKIWYSLQLKTEGAKCKNTATFT
jgi:hypothetical protein